MKRIDFHAHCLPPSYIEFLKMQGKENSDGFPTPQWSIETQLQIMEKAHISFAFFSISSPPVTCADEQTTAKYVRLINDEMASYVRQYPTKLGFFAILPLPYVNLALTEIEYCISTLKCDGFGFPTNYLGDHIGSQKFNQIYSKLNDHKSVICIHPTAPTALPHDMGADFFPVPAMEFFFETTRCVASICINDVVSRFRGIKWIIPHAGACVPIFSDRWQNFNGMMRKKGHANCDFKRDIAALYFDVAGMAVPKLLRDLLMDVPAEHLLYGSDGPYTDMETVTALGEELDRTRVVSDEQREKIYVENALQLCPRLKDIL